MADHFAKEYHNVTTLHPLAVVLVVVMAGLLMLLHRRHALWPFLAIVCFVATSQRLVVGGADFTLLRLMVIAGLVRVIAIEPVRYFHWNLLDGIVLIWALAASAMPLLRAVLHTPEQVGGELVYRVGWMLDALGMYFIFRCLLRDLDDVCSAIRGLAWAVILMTPFIALEWMTRFNAFSIFGGVPAITDMRAGRLRCQGAFAHPILTGCFAASAIPLVLSQWGRPSLRALSRPSILLACGCALFIAFASASATPASAVLVALVGAMLLPLRQWMSMLRWSVLAGLIGLHLIMAAPVWHLIARLSSVSSGNSWHRYALIDGAIRHAHEWWLYGSLVGSGHWGHFTHDVTNMYIVQGLSGGVALVVLFLLILAAGFSLLGRMLKALDRAAPRDSQARSQRLLIWLVGVALFVHAVNHFGVSYFGQVWMGWYLTLAIIGSLYGIAEAASSPSSALTPRACSQPVLLPDGLALLQPGYRIRIASTESHL